jgi:hypothetical protein
MWYSIVKVRKQKTTKQEQRKTPNQEPKRLEVGGRTQNRLPNSADETIRVSAIASRWNPRRLERKTPTLREGKPKEPTMYIVTVQTGPHTFETLTISASNMQDAWSHAMSISTGVVMAVQYDPSLKPV